jgi:hypothetical protein
MAQQCKISMTTGMAMCAVVFVTWSGAAFANAQEGGLKPGPSIVAGDSMKPIRMAHATVEILLQHIGTSAEGVPYFETKKVCKINGEIPVFDSRNISQPMPKQIYFLGPCEAETTQGKVYVKPWVEIDLENRQLDGVSDVKTFFGDLWIFPKNDSVVPEQSAGASASTDDLNLQKLMLSTMSSKMTSSQGSEQIEEFFSALITFVDDGK